MEALLGGSMPIDAARAAEAVGRIAEQLGMTGTNAAAGILRVANANMERAIRVVSVERGHDPRDFALVAFGGCGGLHACEIARELGMRAVIVPRYAGALSALGMLMADAVRDYSAGVLGRSDWEVCFARLERRAQRESPGAPILRSADLRYRGQSYELNVPWPDSAAHFHREHAKVYGYSSPDRAVEIVTLRVRARTPLPKPKLTADTKRAGAAETRRVWRRIWVDGAWRRTAVWKREQLGSGFKSGPALVLDYGSTTLVPPRWRFRVDRSGNLLIQPV
jgi:N-methylhydantoinase A/oxoprolinase/acetone carboxylase beta subunit